jgi:aspartate kinase
MRPIVAKFGGSSLANASQVAKAIAIIQSNPARSHVVVSAPGKRSAEDNKITDLLYQWHAHHTYKTPANERKAKIYARYLDMVKELGIGIDLSEDLELIAKNISNGASAEYAASRGEYLMAKVLASALEYEFIDPASCIRFQGDWHQSYLTYDLVQKCMKGKRVVVAGFYGSDLNGKGIRTFSRGGSDITGAIVARALNAERYENWTDVPGMLTADPRIVACPRGIPTLTYREARELSYMGASVIHPEALFPVEQVSIETHILNTNEPSSLGTRIVPDNTTPHPPGTIIGLAGRQDFTAISIEKALMNQDIGFAHKVLGILLEHKVNFEHAPGSIDSLSIIVESSQLQNGTLERLLDAIKDKCQPDYLDASPHMSMIAVVGQAMARTPGVAAKLFDALADAGINIRMINQGASESSIILGVENNDYAVAIRTIYRRCMA